MTCQCVCRSQALENAGVELIEENGEGQGTRPKQQLEYIEENADGAGVRLQKSGKEKPRK
jgi:hypothetical protein